MVKEYKNGCKGRVWALAFWFLIINCSIINCKLFNDQLDADGAIAALNLNFPLEKKLHQPPSPFSIFHFQLSIILKQLSL
jgi:hypothetical protein